MWGQSVYQQKPLQKAFGILTPQTARFNKLFVNFYVPNVTRILSNAFNCKIIYMYVLTVKGIYEQN